jgi:hypothetical protein
MIFPFIDRVHRLPRLWSNQELRKIAHLFEGDVVNVSAWKDEDKEGGLYRDYFFNGTNYAITNYKAEANGAQGYENEIFLDLEKTLSQELEGKFDVVFNHTTLEHIYEARDAFANLCLMSRDVVITVLPFMQQYHAHYGDYWRFSPEAVNRLYKENGYELVYQSFNNQSSTSVYLFSVASRNPQKWSIYFPDWSFSCEDPKKILQEPYIGCHALPNRPFRLWLRLKVLLMKFYSNKR